MIKELTLDKNMAVSAMNRLLVAAEAKSPEMVSTKDAIIFEAWYGPLIDLLTKARKMSKPKMVDTTISDAKTEFGVSQSDDIIFVGAHGNKEPLGSKQTTHIEKSGLESLFERDPAAVPAAAKTESLLPAVALKKLAAAGVIDQSLVYETKKDGVTIVFPKEAKK